MRAGQAGMRGLLQPASTGMEELNRRRIGYVYCYEAGIVNFSNGASEARHSALQDVLRCADIVAAYKDCADQAFSKFVGR